MTEFLNFDLNQAYATIKENAEAEGVTNKAGFDDMVESFINDKLAAGELNVDEDSEAMIEELKAMWLEYEKNLHIR